MRLTAEILLSLNGHLNALKDRECMLRGMGISAIENLAVLQDQFDLIDLSDNEILKLENLPRMKRLSTIFLANNSVSRVSKGLGAMVPQMKVLDLTKNQLRNLSEIKNISEFQQLEHLSLAGNPVALKPNYRLFVISCMKTLKFLDFQRVTETERQSARELFSGAQGAELMKAVDEEAKAEVEGGAAPQLTAEEKAQVRAAISAAVSKADLDRIELQVQTGTFPFQKDGVEKEPLTEQDEQEEKSKGDTKGGEAASAAGGDETAAAAAGDTGKVGNGKTTSPASSGRRSRSASQASSVGDGDDKGKEKEAKKQVKGDKTAAAAAAKKGTAKKAPARGKRSASIDETAQQRLQQQEEEKEEEKEEKKPAGRKRKQSEETAAAEEQEQDAEVEADVKPKGGRAAAKPKEEKAKKAPATKRAKRK